MSDLRFTLGQRVRVNDDVEGFGGRVGRIVTIDLSDEQIPYVVQYDHTYDYHWFAENEITPIDTKVIEGVVKGSFWGHAVGDESISSVLYPMVGRRVRVTVEVIG